MTTRHDELTAKLRGAAQPERPAAPEFARYLEKVRLHAYKVTDADVQELKDRIAKAGLGGRAFSRFVACPLASAVGVGVDLYLALGAFFHCFEF